MKYFQLGDNFKKSVTFEYIVNLYNFDKDLKSVIFENIRVIEIIIVHVNFKIYYFFSNMRVCLII